jgi:hypothetical protein
MDGLGDGTAPTRIRAHFARAQPLDDHFEAAPRQRPTHPRQVREAETYFREAVYRDVTAVTHQRRRYAAGPELDDRRVCRVQPRGIPGGEQQSGELLGVAEAVSRNASEVREDVLERQLPQVLIRVRSGATNVPRTVSKPSGST